MSSATVSKGMLKAKMLAYLRHIEKTGEELIITDHNRPVLKIVPITPPPPNLEETFADLRGKVIYREEINTSTIAEWSEV